MDFMIETGEKPDRARLSIEAVKKQSKNKLSKIKGLINAAKKSSKGLSVVL